MTGAVGCPACSEPIAGSDKFCESCGADLRVQRDGTVAAVDTTTTCTECGHPVAPEDAGYCPSCGLLASDGTDRVERDLGVVAGVSDRGLVHSRNEDAMALGGHASGLLAAVVCDGVSSSPDPQRASRVAADAALNALLTVADAASPGGPGRDGPVADGPVADRPAVDRPAVERSTSAATPRRVREAVAAAARAVEALADGDDGPACTLVAAVVEPATARVIVAWVGDSRAYWLAAGPGRSRVLTTDHSWAEEVVAAGLYDAATAAADRRAHAITRWLGAGGEPIPDLMTFVADGPGVLLLCSDGLWNYLPDADDLAAAALPRAADDPLGAAAALTTIALDAGGRDNITVVALPVDPRSPS